MASSIFVLPSLSFSDIFHWVAWLCVFYLLYTVYSLYLRRKQLQKNFHSFPGPETHWLYGNTHVFKQDGADLDIVAAYGRKYGYAFPIWLGRFFATMIICHPDYARTILSRQDPKDNFAYRFITPWIGKGLLVLSGPKWFQHRKLLTPGFHYDVLKPYVGVMSDCANVMLDKWEHLASEKKSIELFHHVSLMTLDTIMKCAFSYQSDCQKDSESEYIKAVYDLSYLVDYRFRAFQYHSDLIFNLSPHGYRFRKALRTAHEHTDNVIKQRKESLKRDTELEKIKQKRHLDFLDILLYAKRNIRRMLSFCKFQFPDYITDPLASILYVTKNKYAEDENGQGLSDEDLRAEVDTFMFEGHDTTASGISWTLYCMAKYPEHQDKCREEIRELLGGRNNLEWEDLGKIPYTTMCIKESMRLYPPVPGIARQLTSPVTFPDGRSLPKDSVVLLSIYTINRCPSVWNDPEVFDPLRFSPENSTGRHSYSFVPFSAGSRNCIGQNFAMNEMKVALALTLQRFELSPDPEKVPKKIPQLVLRSVNGVHVYLKKIPQEK